MTSSKKKNYKSKKKSIIVPCTDANQKIKESNAEKARQRKALINKIAAMKAKQELERRQHEAMGVDTSTESIGTIDAMSPTTE